ncbi:MAG: class I SAM-dependent methyltransferase [Ignavibacteriaceae bacterium]|nr:class I SAM-dependent methyltransferase [Ignavibacteriaceae bacterium]
MNKLNLGCGKDIKDGYINLDIVDYGGNMIHNINSFPYPFEENYFDEIYASHVLEHLNSFHHTISEIYRILKPNGILTVYAPFFLNTKYFGEPDHKIEKWKLNHRTNYEGKAQFEVLEKKFITSHFALLKWMDFFVNLEPVIYERFFAGIFSPEEVFFKLRAIK